MSEFFQRDVRHHIRQAVFSDDGALTLLLGVGYLDDNNRFVELKSFEHRVSDAGFAAFFGANTTPDVSRLADLTGAMNAYLIDAGVIDMDVVP